MARDPPVQPKDRFYPESRFGGFTDVDAQVIFFSRVSTLLTPESVVLDIGCGRGRYAADPVTIRRQLRVLKGRCRRVIGIDVDPAAADNPALDEFRRLALSGDAWPVADAAVDLAVSVSVLEHLDDPRHFFAECARVIRAGGYLCLRTSNAWSYSGLAARLIPNRYHAAVIRRLQAHARPADEVFPTRYRCNTVFKIRRMLTQFGFTHCVYGYQSQPTSLAFSRLSYGVGVLHQRYAPRMIKPTIFAFARRLEGR